DEIVFLIHSTETFAGICLILCLKRLLSEQIHVWTGDILLFAKLTDEKIPISAKMQKVYAKIALIFCR
ncbi:MAG: hypothetical protein LUH53_09525, partial [Lachnospiraceae bacterium]|nr:hypothetical protein [Lachnospiraceae bacterium]